MKQNASIAADIAKDLATLNKSVRLNPDIHVTVVGGIAVDTHGKPEAQTNTNIEGLSIPGHFTFCPGGVGRNISEALAKLKLKVSLITALGKDESFYHSNRPDKLGQFLVDECTNQNIQLYPYLVPKKRTAVFTSLSNSDGSFRGGVADMSILNEITPEILKQQHYIDILDRSKMVIMDANIPKETMRFIAKYCSTRGIPGKK